MKLHKVLCQILQLNKKYSAHSQGNNSTENYSIQLCGSTYPLSIDSIQINPLFGMLHIRLKASSEKRNTRVTQ